MRLALVSAYALPHLGGVETTVDTLARGLIARGHEVVHIASNAGVREGRGPDAGTAGLRVVYVGAVNALERFAGVPYPVFGPGLLRTLRTELGRADVVHTHGFIYMGSVAALMMARRMARPIGPGRVLTEHVGHVAYENRVFDRGEAAAIRTLGRLSVAATEVAVVPNGRVGSQIDRMRPDRPAVLIQNGVDTTMYRPPRAGEREALRRRLGWDELPRVLFVGRLVGKKGLDLALAAAAEARGSFELVVVGPGRWPRPRPPGVRFLGPRPRAEVAELYRAADAFLLPSRDEGFPVTVQEAMASGLPAVIGADPAYLPYVDGAGSGVRLAPASSAPVAQAVREVIADPSSGAAATAHARRVFSSERSVDRHEQVYLELAAERGANGSPTAPEPLSAP